MRQLNVVDWETRRVPAPDDLAGWQLLRDAQLAQQTGPSEQTAAREGVSLTDLTLGGVPVLEIGPTAVSDPRRVIVYTHGGAYTMSSARSRLAAIPALANATGMRVMSVDYTTAPAADWQTIQSQVLAVIQALGEQGYAPEDIALIGDSAGGGLATCTALNMRDQGLGSPGAVVLWSPWADLSDDGDTAVTLRDADPILSYDYLLKNSAQAFAQGLDLKDPRVSPVYADFDKGFAPTLIQEGTRTIFLSTSVRLYRKLDDAGHKPVIDMYEGMPHVFQDLSIPEAATAIGKSADFIRSQLG
jgi:acetyl esterase/lipase